MITTTIGWLFVICGIIWAVGAWVRSGMTEYRAGMEDHLSGLLNGIPGFISILLGVALVWR